LFAPELLVGFDGRLALAAELARQAGETTLEFFQTSRFDVERKGDDSPVTVADRQAEQFVRQRLAERFPQDAILGEEFGGAVGSAEFAWIVDPIDGTKSFITGVPLYSTLLAVVHEGRVLAGAIAIPGLSEIAFAVAGRGAWHSAAGRAAIRCQVSRRGLGDGVFLTSQRDSFDKRGAGAGFTALEQRAYVTRTWGDGYGYLLVATGRAEVMVDPIANPWDLAAAQIVVNEAGGRFTSWSGSDSYSAGDGVGSNGRVHDEVLRLLPTA
jgi:histidinol-phosphatase